MSEQFDHDAGLGLPNINELAAGGGGGVATGAPAVEAPAEAAPADGAGVSQSCDVCGKPVTPGGPAAVIGVCDGCFQEMGETKPPGATVAPPAAVEDADTRRVRDIRARLDEIGDPFAKRQRLAVVRSGLLEERSNRDKGLNRMLGEVEDALRDESERAQKAAAERDRLWHELAKLTGENLGVPPGADKSLTPTEELGREVCRFHRKPWAWWAQVKEPQKRTLISLFWAAQMVEQGEHRVMKEIEESAKTA